MLIEDIYFSFAPVNYAFADWMFIVQMSHDEVNQPVVHLRNLLLATVFGTGAGVVIVTCILATYAGSSHGFLYRLLPCTDKMFSQCVQSLGYVMQQKRRQGLQDTARRLMIAKQKSLRLSSERLGRVLLASPFGAGNRGGGVALQTRKSKAALIGAEKGEVSGCQRKFRTRSTL